MKWIFKPKEENHQAVKKDGLEGGKWARATICWTRFVSQPRQKRTFRVVSPITRLVGFFTKFTQFPTKC